MKIAKTAKIGVIGKIEAVILTILAILALLAILAMADDLDNLTARLYPVRTDFNERLFGLILIQTRHGWHFVHEKGINRTPRERPQARAGH